MLDLKTLNVGDKVRVVNNVDNNVERFKFVRVGDVLPVSFGIVIGESK